MSLSTVGDSPITLQSLLKGSNSIVTEDCTLILLGKLYKWDNVHDMFNALFLICKQSWLVYWYSGILQCEYYSITSINIL